MFPFFECAPPGFPDTLGTAPPAPQDGSPVSTWGPWLHVICAFLSFLSTSSGQTHPLRSVLGVSQPIPSTKDTLGESRLRVGMGCPAASGRPCANVSVGTSLDSAQSNAHWITTAITQVKTDTN